MANIVILTGNVNGLRSRSRQRMVLRYLEKSQALVIILQETHLVAGESRELFRRAGCAQNISVSDEVQCCKRAASKLNNEGCWDRA